MLRSDEEVPTLDSTVVHLCALDGIIGLEKFEEIALSSFRKTMVPQAWRGARFIILHYISGMGEGVTRGTSGGMDLVARWILQRPRHN